MSDVFRNSFHIDTNQSFIHSTDKRWMGYMGIGKNAGFLKSARIQINLILKLKYKS